MQMTLQDRDKLLVALRDGSHPQGIHALEHKGHFCCLGVFSVLFYKDVGLDRNPRSDGLIWYRNPEKKTTATVDLHQDFWGRFQCTGHGFSVPEKLLTSRQLDRIKWDGRDEEIPAMSLNDGGLTFSEIADLAEKIIVVIDNYEDRNVVFDPYRSNGTTAAA